MKGADAGDWLQFIGALVAALIAEISACRRRVTCGVGSAALHAVELIAEWHSEETVRIAHGCSKSWSRPWTPAGRVGVGEPLYRRGSPLPSVVSFFFDELPVYPSDFFL